MVGDAIALHLVSAEVRDAARQISRTPGLALDVTPHLTVEDPVEDLGGVAAGVALSPDRAAEDDEILAERAVQQRHLPHCAACIVEDPAARSGMDVGGIPKREGRSDSVEGFLQRK